MSEEYHPQEQLKPQEKELLIGELVLRDGTDIKYGTQLLFHLGLHFTNPFIDESLFKYYEEVEARLRYIQAKPGDIMLDIGAMVGSWTLHGAALGAHVHAFEIGIPHLRALDFNIHLNNLQKRVSVHNTALYSDDTKELLFNGQMKTLERPDNHLISVNTIPVQSITLDTWVKQHKYELPHINFIKIDVEGMEFHVLNGAINTIKEYKPRIVVEIHEQEDTNLRTNIESLMSSLGYMHEHILGLNDYFYPEPTLTRSD